MNSSSLFSRRKMLLASAEAITCAAGLSAFKPLLAAAGSRGFKIGACDWCLGKAANPESFDLARQIGVDGLQIDMGNTANGMRLVKPEVQQAYRDASRRTGLAIASLAIGELNKVPLKKDPRAAAWLAQSIDVCKALDLPVVLAPEFYAGDLDMNKTAEIDHFVAVLKEVAPKAETAEIAIGLENYLMPRTTGRSSTAWAPPPSRSTTTWETRRTRDATW